MKKNSSQQSNNGLSPNKKYSVNTNRSFIKSRNNEKMEEKSSFRSNKKFKKYNNRYFYS